MRTLLSCAMVVLLAAAPCLCSDNDKPQPQRQQIEHTRQNIEGWTVQIDTRLLDSKQETGREALKLLANRLHSATLVIPAEPLARLQEVPIWIDLDHRLGAMQYHPNAKWLEDHGYDRRMAKAVHIPDARRFIDIQRSNDQPSVVIHEFAHAYHDRVLGFDHPKIKGAYRQAVQEGRYASVLHISGKTKRHYALRDHKEYFAEATVLNKSPSPHCISSAQMAVLV